MLSKDPKKITVVLKFPSRKATGICGISPGHAGPWPLESFHYLFGIYGERHSKATVEITFPNAPPGTTHAEIIVCKTPIDTKPFGDSW